MRAYNCIGTKVVLFLLYSYTNTSVDGYQADKHF